MANLTIEQGFETSAEFLTNGTTTTALGSEFPPLDWDGTPIPEEVFEHPLIDEAAWVALRDSGRDPLDQSELVTTHQSRVEFLVGAWIIDKIVPVRMGGSLLKNLQPQMLREADVLAAERFKNAVLMPRRSSKTTSLWCVLLGRCWMRPLHMAGYTMMTTAKKAGERFKLDVRDPITRKWREKRTRPLKLTEGNGALGVEFDNGSKLAVLTPNGDDVRSGAYDTLVMDEAGEAEPDVWEDIIAAVVPSFDTRGEGAQLILAGTGGKYREGSYFWTVLHDPGSGRLRYGVPDDIDEELLTSWEAGAGRLIEPMHPGLDGLTTLDKIRANFPDLGAARFALEYLGHFGKATGNDTIMPGVSWAKTTQPGTPPEGITPGALAFAVHPGGAWSSVAVAWHLEDAEPDLARAAWKLDGLDEATPPRAGFKLIHHQEGNARMAGTLWKLWKLTRLPIVYDSGNPQDKAIIGDLLRMARPRPEVRALTYGEKAVAATNLLNVIKTGDAEHWEQEPLDRAAARAVPRISGKSTLFGIPDSDPTADITGLEAVSYALFALPAPAVEDSFAPIIVS